MNRVWDLVKIVLAVILFGIGTLFIGTGIYGLSDSVGTGIAIIVMGLLAFIYPVMKIIRYVSERRESGKKWIALPAVAVSIPLMFSTCAGLVSGTKKTEETTSTQVTVYEEKQLDPSEESTSVSETPATAPTESETEVTAKETSEITSETTETTVVSSKETTVETTVSKETTAETTEAPSTTTTEEKHSEETEAPSETSEAIETEAETEAPPVVVDEPDSPAGRETVEVKSEEQDYILNTSKMKFHEPDCPSVKQMSEKNKEKRHCSREELINEGYDPCGRCHP